MDFGLVGMDSLTSGNSEWHVRDMESKKTMAFKCFLELNVWIVM